jgi:Fic/DOC family
LRAEDWGSFHFAYSLDLRRLIPHILAIEEYKAAVLSPVLPPHWLEVPGALERPVEEITVLGDKPAFDAEAAPSPDLSIAQQPQENRSTAGRKVWLIRNTSVARAWIRQRFGPGSAPLSLADILTIHRMVGTQAGGKGESVGALRTLPVEVGREEVGGVHAGAPVEKLQLLMDQYIQFINGAYARSLPPAIRALLANFFLNTIHPFLDGNGRTSRLVAAAILSHHGYNLHGTYAIARHFYRHEIRYQSILHQIWKRCPFEVTPFVAFGLEGFVLELKSVDSFIKMKLNRIGRDIAMPAFAGRIGARRRVGTAK